MAFWKKTKKTKALVKKEEDKLTQVPFGPQAPPVFRSKLNKKRKEAFTEVLRAEESLVDAYKGQQRALDELNDLDTLLATDRFNRQADKKEAEARLKGAERQVKESDQKDRVSKLGLDVQEEKLKADLEEIKNPSKNDPVEKERENLERKRKIEQVKREDKELRIKQQIERYDAREEELLLKKGEVGLDTLEEKELGEIRDNRRRLKKRLYKEDER